MYEIKYDYIGYYKSLNIDESKSITKWRPVIQRVSSNENFIRALSIFAEKYSIIEQSVNFGPTSIGKTWYNTNGNLPELLTTISKNFDNFILNNSKTKLNIVSEYYNTITGKRGLLLEHGIRIEDGKFLDPKHQEKIDKIVSNFLNMEIECALDPSRRKNFNRENKISRILKGD